jgi:hypothetical protein
VDIVGGKPPSTMQMFRMAANAEFRAAAKRVAAELENAGIKIDSQVGYPLFQFPWSDTDAEQSSSKLWQSS